MRQGLYYKLDVYDLEGRPLGPQTLEKQLQWIVDDAELHQGITSFPFLQDAGIGYAALHISQQVASLHTCVMSLYEAKNNSIQMCLI